MISKIKINVVLIVLGILVLSLSVYFSFRPFNGSGSWTQNDTYNYYKYTMCVKDYSISYCNSILGINFFELTLPSFSVLSLFLFDNHYFLFFSGSVLFFLALFYFYKDLNHYLFLAIPLIILSPSFWELNLNIIRNSFAISFFIIALGCYNASAKLNYKSIFFCLLSLLSHTAGLIYTAIYYCANKVELNKLLLIFCLLLIIPGSVTDYVIDFFGYIPFVNETTIIRKLNAYSAMKVEGDSIVSIIGKVYLISVFVLTYLSKKIEDEKYIFICKVLLLILIVGVLFKDSSIVYRIINVYLYLIFYLIIYGIMRKNYFAYALYFLCLLWVGYDFSLNFSFYLRFL